MLKSLKVINLAVVERAEIAFGGGLNVITGETGAGKSVLMGALELVLGGRAEASAVRDGAREAEVEAEFDGFVIRRTVTREGRSRAWINDESVAVTELRELGRKLVDIHGPTANQRLVEEDFQRELLGPVAASYADVYGEYASERRRLEELEASGADEDELDLLRYQVSELEGAGLTEEDETVAERHAAAAHAEEIIGSANEITEGLGGDRGAAETLIALQPKFRAMARHFPSAEAWAIRAEELTLGVQELSRSVADAISRLDAGEEDLSRLDARLTVICNLKRKYRRDSVAGLIALAAEKRERLDLLENRGERLEALRKELAELKGKVVREGAVLTGKRRAAAEKLAKAVTRELKDLGFLQAKFHVALEAAEPAAHGCDRVVFMFEPNPGEPARPLAAIASSGEIARVMLALKVVFGGTAGTMVFDEIDANIGGEVGKATGEKLRNAAKRNQVIAITHLPQSAVYGERHFVVVKSTVGGRTRTGVKQVEGEARVREIARMLGGEKLTSVVKRHAEELLELSR